MGSVSVASDLLGKRLPTLAYIVHPSPRISSYLLVYQTGRSFILFPSIPIISVGLSWIVESFIFAIPFVSTQSFPSSENSRSHLEFARIEQDRNACKPERSNARTLNAERERWPSAREGEDGGCPHGLE